MIHRKFFNPAKTGKARQNELRVYPSNSSGMRVIRRSPAGLVENIEKVI